MVFDSRPLAAPWCIHDNITHRNNNLPLYGVVLISIMNEVIKGGVEYDNIDKNF